MLVKPTALTAPLRKGGQFLVDGCLVIRNGGVVMCRTWLLPGRTSRTTPPRLGTTEPSQVVGEVLRISGYGGGGMDMCVRVSILQFFFGVEENCLIIFRKGIEFVCIFVDLVHWLASFFVHSLIIISVVGGFKSSRRIALFLTFLGFRQ